MSHVFIVSSLIDERKNVKIVNSVCSVSSSTVVGVCMLAVWCRRL